MTLPFVISLGSNLCPVEAEAKLNKAEIFLSKLFGNDIRFSKHYQTAGVGSGAGKVYTNSVVIGDTELSHSEITQSLKAFELSEGRNNETRIKGIVPIDVDLLVLGDIIYKPKDLQQSYVTQGLEELSLTSTDD